MQLLMAAIQIISFFLRFQNGWILVKMEINVMQVAVWNVSLITIPSDVGVDDTRQIRGAGLGMQHLTDGTSRARARAFSKRFPCFPFRVISEQLYGRRSSAASPTKWMAASLSNFYSFGEPGRWMEDNIHMIFHPIDYLSITIFFSSNSNTKNDKLWLKIEVDSSADGWSIIEYTIHQVKVNVIAYHLH